MKALSTLIRLQKQRVDALRRRLGALQNQRAKLLQKDASLARELEQELKLANEQPVTMGSFFGDFAQRIKRKRAEIAGEIGRIDEHITAVTDQIRDAFSEMKRYEIARDNRKKAAVQRTQKRETAQLDEIASQRHHRQDSSS